MVASLERGQLSVKFYLERLRAQVAITLPRTIREITLDRTNGWPLSKACLIPQMASSLCPKHLLQVAPAALTSSERPDPSRPLPISA